MSAGLIVQAFGPARGVAAALTAVAVIFATGCAGQAAAPSTTKVPVATPCPTTLPPRPAFPADTLTGDEDIWTKGTVLWADYLARKAYAIELETRLKGCIEPATP